MFYWAENRILAKGLKFELTLVASLKIKPGKYSAGKYVWHRFWKGDRKAKGRSRKVNRTSVYAEAAVRMIP